MYLVDVILLSAVVGVKVEDGESMVGVVDVESVENMVGVLVDEVVRVKIMKDTDQILSTFIHHVRFVQLCKLLFSQWPSGSCDNTTLTASEGPKRPGQSKVTLFMTSIDTVRISHCWLTSQAPRA